MGQQYKNLDEDKATNHRKKRILFVNDDTDTTAVMKVGLSRHGFEVETFVDSKSEIRNECFIQKPVRIKEIANSIDTILRN